MASMAVSVVPYAVMMITGVLTWALLDLDQRVQAVGARHLVVHEDRVERLIRQAVPARPPPSVQVATSYPCLEKSRARKWTSPSSSVHDQDRSMGQGPGFQGSGFREFCVAGGLARRFVAGMRMENVVPRPAASDAHGPSVPLDRR